MQLNSVVLPAPLGPISPTIEPGSRSNDTPASAITPPNRTERSLTRKSGACVIPSVPIPRAPSLALPRRHVTTRTSRRSPCHGRVVRLAEL